MNVTSLLEVLRGVPGTLLLGLLSFTGGVVLALPLSAARLAQNWLLRTVALSFIEIVRAIPPIVWVFLIYFGVSQYVLLDSLTAAVLALAIVSAAYIAEIYRGGLAAVTAGQREAAQALGIGRNWAMILVIAPQAARIAIPSLTSYGIGLLKDTSIAFTIGYSEIMFYATNASQTSNDPLGPFIVAGLLYIVLAVPCGYGARFLDRALTRRVTA